MLVLSRKLGEEIVIGGDLRVTVIEIRGQRVKLGLVGPPEVRIRRRELVSSAETGEKVGAAEE
jgi:carbon storage regulator